MESIREKVFRALTLDAKLYLNLQKNITPEERFAYYVTTFNEFRRLNGDAKTPENLKVIMQKIHNFIELYSFQNGSFSEELFTFWLFCSMHCPELVKLFINSGANPDYQNKLGETPLHHAASFWFAPDEENIFLSAELLASAMKNTDVKNNSGKNALESINHDDLYYPKEKSMHFKQKFKKIIENPRPPYMIETVTTAGSNASFNLVEQDRIDIELYNQVLSTYGDAHFPDSMENIVLCNKGRTLKICEAGATYTDQNPEELKNYQVKQLNKIKLGTNIENSDSSTDTLVNFSGDIDRDGHSVALQTRDRLFKAPKTITDSAKDPANVYVCNSIF